MANLHTLVYCFSACICICAVNAVSLAPISDTAMTAMIAAGWLESGYQCDSDSRCISTIRNNLKEIETIDLSYTPPILGANINGSSFKINGTILAEVAAIPTLITLNLRDNDLTGAIPSFAATATLQYLDLGGNKLGVNFITGDVMPAHISTLIELISFKCQKCNFQTLTNLSANGKLKVLNMKKNRLSGEIPAWVWTMDELSLGDNADLSGPLRGSSSTLPSNPSMIKLVLNDLPAIQQYLFNSVLVAFPNLVELDLSGNPHQAFATIPTSLYNMPALKILNLSKTGLIGSFANLWAPLADTLTDLNLGDNKVSGDFPDSLCQLTNMKNLFLNKIDFVPGPIPACVLTAFQQIKDLDLSGTGRTGPLPTNINLPTLEKLYLSDNMFSGPITSAFTDNLQVIRNLQLDHQVFPGGLTGSIAEGTIGSLQTLENLDLSRNLLVGPIPPDFSGLTSLKKLNMNKMGLTGVLSTYVANIFSKMPLIRLELDENSITAPNLCIAEFAQMTFLEELVISHNQIVGGFPNCIFQYNFPLSLLDVSGNDLGGTLTIDSLANKLLLKDLHFQACKFTGTLPSGVDLPPNLKVINFKENNLQGTIPVNWASLTNLREIALARCLLTGPVFPAEFSVLTQLKAYDVGDNFFTGDIGGLSSLTLLEDVEVRANNLTGPIPTSFNQLVNLKFLDLSQNNFNGPIHAFLATIVRLDRLLLHDNDFDANIPAGFATRKIKEFTLRGNAKMCPLDASTVSLAVQDKVTDVQLMCVYSQCIHLSCGDCIALGPTVCHFCDQSAVGNKNCVPDGSYACDVNSYDNTLKEIVATTECYENVRVLPPLVNGTLPEFVRLPPPTPAPTPTPKKSGSASASGFMSDIASLLTFVLLLISVFF